MAHMVYATEGYCLECDFASDMPHSSLCDMI